MNTTSRNGLRQNFTRVARANVIALMLPLLATPVLSRLYKPSSFATLAVFVAVLGLLTAFATWRFDWSIPNESEPVMAASLLLAGATVLVAVCTITGVILGVGRSFGAWEHWASTLGALVFLIPVALLANGISELLTGWFVRAGDLSPVSRSTIGRSVTNVAASTGFGWANWGPAGLVVASVVAAWASIGTLLVKAGRSFGIVLRQASLRAIGVVSRRHFREASWSTAVSVLNAISANAAILTLSAFFSLTQVGWYALVFRLVTTPVGALTNALAHSFWSEAAALARDERWRELESLYRRTTKHLGYAAIPVASVCLAGPLFVGPLLGKEWTGAGHVLTACTPWIVGSIMFSATNHLVVMGRQRDQLFADFVRVVLSVAGIAAAHLLGLGFVTAVWLASFGSLTGHVALFILHRKAHKSHV